MDEIQALQELLGKRKSYQDIYDQFRVGTEQFPQRENQVVIESSPAVQKEPGVLVPYAGVPSKPVPQYTQENVNNILGDKLDQEAQKKAEVESIREKYEKTMSEYGQGLPSELPEYAPNKERMAAIQSLNEKLGSAQAPERNMWAEALISFGPALLGGLTGGRAGLGAVEDTAKQARSLYEGMRKEDIEAVKQSKEQIKAQIKALDNLEKTDKDAFYKSQNNVMRMLDLRTKVQANAVNLRGKELESAKKDIQQLDKWIADSAIKSTFKVGDQEQRERQMDIQEKGVQARKQAVLRPKEPSQGEREAAGRLGRAQKASGELKSLGADTMAYPALKDTVFDQKLSAFSNEGVWSTAVNAMVKDPDTRRAIQAEMDWGMNFLRDETGAAIAKGELPKELNKYFPRKNDDIKTIKAKSSSRKQVEEGLRIQAGKAPVARVEAPQEPSKKAEKVDPDAKKYAEMHSIPLDQAAEIIRKRKAKLGVK